MPTPATPATVPTAAPAPNCGAPVTNPAASPGTKMTIDIKSIRFTKSRAIEIGVATLTPAKGDPTTVAYRAIHAKQPDGKWLMTSVGPDVTAEGATSAGALDELSWMLGSWQDSEENVDVKCHCRWDAYHRFMLRTFVISEKDRPALEVTEIIGWDAADRIIRSWVFDSDGGFGQNTWNHRGDEWIISARGTLADGGRTFKPVRVAFHEWQAMFHDAREATNWRDKLGYVVGPPGWQPKDQRATAPAPTGLETQTR